MVLLNPRSRTLRVDGPAGALECAINDPADGAAPRGVAVLCHALPIKGGTMEHKVLQTLMRAFVQLGWRVVRFNFRGVGASEGTWDAGRGEIDDALAVVASQRDASLPLVLGGFSFGSYVASQAASRLPEGQRPQRLVLVAPASTNFRMADVPQDTLVIHGELDDVVPLQATFDWARPQALPVVVVPSAGHFFDGQLAVLKMLAVQAFS